MEWEDGKALTGSVCDRRTRRREISGGGVCDSRIVLL